MTSAEAQRRWRRRARQRLLELYGNFCGFCGANGGTRLEFAHRARAARTFDDRWRMKGRGSDRTIREVRTHPFNFLPLCRDCHRSLDGSAWRETVRLVRGRA